MSELKLKSIFLCLGLFGAMAVALLCTTSAFALSLSINPSKVRVSVAPGQTNRGVITLENNSGLNIDVQVYLEDWQYDSSQTGTKLFKSAGTHVLSSASWITFAPAQLSIAPYGKSTVGYTIAAPADSVGGHYAVLFFETTLAGTAPAQEESSQGAKVDVYGRIGTLFYVDSGAPTTYKAYELTNFSAVRSNKDAPLEVSFDLQNTGNIDITAGGTFHIMDAQGIILARNEFNEVFTFPQEKAKLISRWKESIPAGSYDLVVTLDLDRGADRQSSRRGMAVLKEAKITFDEQGKVVSAGPLQ
jgi:hypothetical protein